MRGAGRRAIHEMGVATELYRVCRSELRARGGERLDEVRIAVGELSAIEPELLAFAWQALVEGGPDAGARLEIEWHPARQRCPACGEVAQRQPGSWLRLCPDCESPLHLEGGHELDILTLAFEVEADRAEARP